MRAIARYRRARSPVRAAFIALEREQRDVIALLKRERNAGRVPLTHGGVVAQVWRGGARRQANIARLLPAVDVVPLDEQLGLTRKTDVVVLLAVDGDSILTSDAKDLLPLAAAAAVHVDIVPVR